MIPPHEHGLLFLACSLRPQFRQRLPFLARCALGLALRLVVLVAILYVLRVPNAVLPPLRCLPFCKQIACIAPVAVVFKIQVSVSLEQAALVVALLTPTLPFGSA